MVYKLEFIPGTEVWVEEELCKQHPNIKIKKKAKNELIFESSEDIDAFRDILCGLRIRGENHKNDLNLFRREWRRGFVPAGINPALAYVLCQIAGIKSDDVVLDPFCGGGTIAITVSSYFQPKQVIASDISGKAIDITENNILLAETQNIMVFRSDVSKLKLGKDSISKVITNLPFGIREKSHEKNIIIYENFAKKLQSALKSNGEAIILTQEIKLVQDVFRKYGFQKIGDYPIEQGGLKPHIFIFKLNKS